MAGRRSRSGRGRDRWPGDPRRCHRRVPTEVPGRPHERARSPKAPARLAMRAVDPLGGYDGQARCIHRAQRGTKSLARVLGARVWQLPDRHEPQLCEGRRHQRALRQPDAIDWMVDSRSAPSTQAGDFVKWLTMAQGLNLGASGPARRHASSGAAGSGRLPGGPGWQEYSTAWIAAAPRAHRTATVTQPSHLTFPRGRGAQDIVVALTAAAQQNPYQRFTLG